MKAWLALLIVAVLWRESASQINNIELRFPTAMGPPGVHPIDRTVGTFLMGEYHGYFMNDGTVDFWEVNPGPVGAFNKLVTWNLPTEFQGGSKYALQAMQLLSSPNPTVSWLMAKENRVWRIQCGPGTLCYRTSEDVIIPDVNVSRPITVIAPLNAGDYSRMIAASTDYVSIIDELPRSLKLFSVFSWANTSWAQRWPVDRITGLVSSPPSKSLLIAFSPEDPLGVGYIVRLLMTGPGTFGAPKPTMLQRATQTFNAWSSPSSPTPIYYWLEELPFNGLHQRNAFVKSQGGQGFDPLAAGGIFETNEQWANVFIADTPTRTGLLISGTPGAAGFTAWSPVFGLNVCPPEVTLGQYTTVNASLGFSMPMMATYVFRAGRKASAVSYNVLNDTSYLIILDWDHTPYPWCWPKDEAEKSTLNAQRSTYSSSVSAGSTSSSSRPHPSRDAKSDAEHLKHQDYVLHETLNLYNCTRSTCGFLNNGNCPAGDCWNLGGQGGFYCCLQAPTA